ncbi:hypothetical protein PHMEG_00041267, partial [Phytophthora megakarya]
PHSYAPIYLSTVTLFGLEDGSPTFTIDAWFSLSPIKHDVRQGGILFGLQNEKCQVHGQTSLVKF